MRGGIEYIINLYFFEEQFSRHQVLTISTESSKKIDIVSRLTSCAMSLLSTKIRSQIIDLKLLVIRLNVKAVFNIQLIQILTRIATEINELNWALSKRPKWIICP